MLVHLTYITWSSDFALFLEGSLMYMYEHHISLDIRKGTRWSKFPNFSFLHKTEEKCHRIYYLLLLLPNFEEKFINDVIKCCHYNDKFIPLCIET